MSVLFFHADAWVKDEAYARTFSVLNHNRGTNSAFTASTMRVFWRRGATSIMVSSSSHSLYVTLRRSGSSSAPGHQCQLQEICSTVQVQDLRYISDT